MTVPYHPVRLGIGLDVGGTKIAGGVIGEDGTVVDRLTTPTPVGADADATLAILLDLVDRLRARHPSVEAIGVGAPGMVEWPRGSIRWAPNNAYRDLHLKERLATKTGLPVVVDNDANAAAWAEARFGRGAGRSHVVVLTIGTGIGGGLILDGELYRGRTGLGAEVGHIIVNPAGGHRCGCGATGCLEAEGSGTALRRMARDAVAREPTGLIAREAAGLPEVTGEIVLRAARMGDATACSLFDRLGYWLGVGIASLVNIFEPETVIIGGGLIEAGDYLLASTLASIDEHIFAHDLRQTPPIAAAMLGAEAGVVGAAALALGSDDRSPSRT